MTDSDGPRHFLDASGSVWQRKITYECYTLDDVLTADSCEELEHNYGPIAELFPATNPGREVVSAAPTLWPAGISLYGTVIIPSFDPEPDQRLILAGRYLNQEVILLYDHTARNWRFLSMLPTFQNFPEYTWVQLRCRTTGSFEVIGATQGETS